MPAVTTKPRVARITTTTTTVAVALALLAGACGRGDDPSVHAGVDVAPVTTTVPLDDDSDLPPIPVPIDPASIPPGPRLIGMGPAQLAKLGFVLLDPVGVPKIGKDLAAVLGLHQAGEGTVTDVVLARVTNGQGVGSCELCWVVSVKHSAAMPLLGPAPGPGSTQQQSTTIGPPLEPGYYFMLIDGTTGHSSPGGGDVIGTTSGIPFEASRPSTWLFGGCAGSATPRGPATSSNRVRESSRRLYQGGWPPFLVGGLARGRSLPRREAASHSRDC